MANLKYVCLSDLHLGAAYSILTADDPLQQSPTLRAFATALGNLIRNIGTAPPPRLLLLGDILDLGLSPINKAAMGFQRFVEALFPPGIPSRLAPDVVCVPGNHDHFLWQWAEDNHYVGLIGKTNAAIPDLVPVTPLFPTPGKPDGDYVDSVFLTTLMCNASKNPSASVRLAYPNLGDWRPGGRCVVFHHGHFIEPIYRLMSDLRRFLRLGGRGVTSVAELERENAAWIDFVWSTLGDAGEMGKDAETLYSRLQDAAATERFIAPLARRLVTYLQPQLPMGGEREVQTWARRVVRAVLDLTIQRTAELERNSYLTVLTPGSVAGLQWYLDTPLAQQFRKERSALPDDLVFVFGHTHKPFEDALPLAPYKLPVRVFNTGGWVLDEPTMMSLEGAAMVLVDDELNVVSVRLYNQPVNDEPLTVQVPPGSGAYPQSGNTLLDAVTNALKATKADWDTFGQNVTAALEKRQRYLIRHFDLDPTVRDNSTEASSAR